MTHTKSIANHIVGVSDGKGFTMSKIKKKALRLVSKTALANAKKEADSICILFGYQPKIPERLRKQQANRK